MEKLLNIFSNQKTLVLVGTAVLVFAGVVFLYPSENGKEESLVVVSGEFLQQVSVSGKVTATESVDLSFPDTDRVTSIFVKVGDKVSERQVLASLTTSALASNLRAAEADLAVRRAERGSTSVNLEEVRKEQNELVLSAYSELLSEGLVAVPNSSSYTAEAPLITGRYSGAEGTYKLSISRRTATSDDFELRTFNLEKTGPVEIFENEPTALGTHGLFVSFPDLLNEYNDTIWYVTIPNTKSSSYLANYNAYQEALRARDRAIADAEAKLGSTEGSTVLDAQVQSAEAEIARIRTLISERSLRAPFNAVVTAVPIKVGGLASSNEPAISLISAKGLQIESYVPETNLSLLKVGDEAEVTLDAYGSTVPFATRIVSIDPAETIRDGVSTYRAVLYFDEQDERVRAGMTANVVITTDRRENIISIPQGLVTKRDGKSFVRVREGNEVREQEVVTGSVSSSGTVEIISGLSAGEEVLAEL